MQQIVQIAHQIEGGRSSLGENLGDLAQIFRVMWWNKVK